MHNWRKRNRRSGQPLVKIGFFRRITGQHVIFIETHDILLLTSPKRECSRYQPTFYRGEIGDGHAKMLFEQSKYLVRFNDSPEVGHRKFSLLSGPFLLQGPNLPQNHSTKKNQSL